MPGHRGALPQLGDRIFLTDSGTETDLVHHHGLDLPSFATFPLLDRAGGREHLRRYYRDHLEVAARHATGFILEAPTWRANADWGPGLGYDQDELDRVNADAISFMIELATAPEFVSSEMVISGCIGPRSDAYLPTTVMDAAQAQAYHRRQIEAFAATEADLVHAMTIGYADEAIGIVAAALEAGIPAAVSFTLETDGRLPDGSTLAAAVRQVDAATGGAAAYFGINCAHPDHIAAALSSADSATVPTAGGRTGCAACGPTPRGAATPSSTNPTSSMTATRSSSPRATGSCARSSPGSPCSGAAAAPTPGMWPRSPPPAPADPLTPADPAD